MTDLASDSESSRPSGTPEDRNAVFNQQAPPTRATVHQPIHPLKVMGFGSIAIIVLVWLLANAINTRFRENSVQQELNSLKSTLASGDVAAPNFAPLSGPILSEAERAKAEIAAAEKIALNRAALRSFRDKLARLQASAADAEDVLTELSKSFSNLATNEMGRRIATDSKQVKQFGLLRENAKRPIVLDEAASFAAEMSKFVATADFETAVDFRPSSESVSRLVSLSVSCDGAKSELEQFKLALDALVSSATNNDVGSLTLEAAVQKVMLEEKQREADQLMMRLTKARDEEKEIGAQALEEAERKKVASRNRLEQAKIVEAAQRNNDVAKSIEVQNEANAVKAAKAREKQKLRNEFDLVRAEALRYLAPFVGQGLKYRGKSEGRGPMSLSLLTSSGALEATTAGMIELSKLAQNDRPKNGFPQWLAYAYFDDPRFTGQVAYVEKAQQFLKKFGELMVEEGLLAE